MGFRLWDSLPSHDDSRGPYSHLPTRLSVDDSHALYDPRGNSRVNALYSLPLRIFRTTVARFGKKKGTAIMGVCASIVLLLIIGAFKHFVAHKNRLVMAFDHRACRKIWEWEIQSGHHPSSRPVPPEIGFRYPLQNPAIPPARTFKPPGKTEAAGAQWIKGTGRQRTYNTTRCRSPHCGNPPRPIAGSVADLDRIAERCDYDRGKYTRDCHEYLRLGAGLDNDVRLRRANVTRLQYVYTTDDSHVAPILDTEVTLRTIDGWERTLPPPSYDRHAAHCNDDDPRIFHMFWHGPITDKPYMAIMSFFYTQNLGLHLDTPPSDGYCRPQLWLWVSRGSVEATPSDEAVDEMYEELRVNPWASPFLHPRFKNIIQFRLWSTAEQLDSVPEFKDDWRRLGIIPGMVSESHTLDILDSAPATPPKGRKVTAKTYDKLPVVLSDLVRWVVCHRFGGIYLDIDALFLRDWEELWGWSGSFSYHWSRLDIYNTAVLRLRRGSALGTYLLRMGLANNLDFHPHTITNYLRAGNLDGLLYRVPDAVFDPAWVTTVPSRKYLLWDEKFHQDRPTVPFFTDFDQFFNTPPQMSGAPSVVGFDGFFRGAFLYHYHNEWWKPFDKAMNWPDLGPKFADAERMGRAAAENRTGTYPVGLVEDDEQDLGWATVLKRTFEAYIRGERPNMYGEWIRW